MNCQTNIAPGRSILCRLIPNSGCTERGTWKRFWQPKMVTLKLTPVPRSCKHYAEWLRMTEVTKRPDGTAGNGDGYTTLRRRPRRFTSFHFYRRRVHPCEGKLLEGKSNSLGANQCTTAVNLCSILGEAEPRCRGSCQTYYSSSEGFQVVTVFNSESHMIRNCHQDLGIE